MNNILELAKKTILQESNAIKKLSSFLDENFINAVNEIHNSKGRVIITGIGKSANISTKIVATLNSTGTPSIFMHAADAIHGDLGNIQINDVVICISKSGNTPEIEVLLPLIKNLGNKIIAITGNMDSFLAKKSDFILNTFVDKEACPNNLAPTTSTTAQLVMGDALAVCLEYLKGFTPNDFARYHPGGSLGKRLYLRVHDILLKNSNPKVNLHSNIKDVIIEISSKRLGSTAVLDNNELKGIITDGDIRRMLQKNDTLNNISALDIMTENPKTIDINSLAVKALELMEDNRITSLIVTDKKEYKGIIHLHDLIKEGII